MPIYTFYLHERAEKVPAFEIGLFDNAAAAAAEGQRLLRERPRYAHVEITSEDQPVARVSRADADGFSVSFATSD